MSSSIDLYETLYGRAIEALAQGATWDETRGWLIDSYPSASPDDVSEAMTEARDDADALGLDREDLDDSWWA